MEVLFLLSVAGSKDGEKYFRKNEGDESAALRAIEEGTSRPVEPRLSIKNITDSVGDDDPKHDTDPTKKSDSDADEQCDAEAPVMTASDIDTVSVKSDRDIKVERASPEATAQQTTEAEPPAEQLRKPTPISPHDYLDSRLHAAADRAPPTTAGRPPWVSPFCSGIFTADSSLKVPPPGRQTYDSYKDMTLRRETEFMRNNYSDFIRSLAAKYKSNADR